MQAMIFTEKPEMKNEQLTDRVDALQQKMTKLIKTAGKMPANQKAVLDEVLKGLSTLRKDLETDGKPVAQLDSHLEPVTTPLSSGEDEYQQLRASGTDYVFTVEIKDGRTVSTTHGPGCVAVTGYTAAEYA